MTHTYGHSRGDTSLGRTPLEDKHLSKTDTLIGGHCMASQGLMPLDTSVREKLSKVDRVHGLSWVDTSPVG